MEFGARRDPRDRQPTVGHQLATVGARFRQSTRTHEHEERSRHRRHHLAAPRADGTPPTAEILAQRTTGAHNLDEAEPTSRHALGDQLEEVERAAIIKALEQTRYNKTAAAKALGMTFRALRYRIKKLGIE